MSLILASLFFTLIHFYQIHGCRLNFIAEYGNTNGEITSRSAASYGRTVRFTKEGQFVYWHFITQSQCNIDVLNVHYTNDGPSDNLTIYINKNVIGSFQTIKHASEGVFWNKIVESGLVGRTTFLSQGNHTLNISVASVDMYGVEIDKVIIGVLCDDDLCSVNILEQPTNYNIAGEPDDFPGDLTLDKGHIISIVVGVCSTVISALIAIPTLVVAIWSIHKCIKGEVKHSTNPSKLSEPLI